MLGAASSEVEMGSLSAEEDGQLESDVVDNDGGGGDGVGVFSPLLLVVSIVGVGTNLGSIAIFMRQKFRKDFHRLLIILAAYDLLVVITCIMMYCLPDLWPYYVEQIFPRIVPVLLPLVQISLMSSVYCTIVLSWERYVRICLVSNFVSSYNFFTNFKFKLYVGIITLFPVLFYLPRFFEFRHVVSTHHYNETVFCINLEGEGAASSDLEFALISFTLSGDVPARLIDECRREREVGHNNDTVIPHEKWIQKCCSPQPELQYAHRLNVSRTHAYPSIEGTWLREDPLYYNIYCLGLNTVFATAVPFLLLLYLNVSTVIALKRMTTSASVHRSFGQTISMATFSHPSSVRNSTVSTVSSMNFEGGQSQGRQRQQLRRSNSPVCRRRENRLTRISLAIVWLFLFCHIWKIIPSAYEMAVGPVRAGEPAWMEYIQHLSHGLIVLNSSVNFLIYWLL